MSLARLLPRRSGLAAIASLRIAPLYYGTVAKKKSEIEIFDNHIDRGKFLIEKGIKTETLKDLSQESDVKGWTDNHLFFHRDEVISGGISKKAFETLSQRIGLCNKFVLPLPKREGDHHFQVEGKGGEVHFSSLKDLPVDLETQDEQACCFPSMVLKFFSSLRAGSDNAVLFRGLVQHDKLTVEEGRYLAKLFLLFYTGNDEAFSLISEFNEKPEFFQVERISQLITKSSIHNPFHF